MGKLFGTDGMRGVAGEPPLDAKTVFAVGRAVGEFLRETVATVRPLDFARGNRMLRVLLGEDTREASPMGTSYLAGGLRAGGGEGGAGGGGRQSKQRGPPSPPPPSPRPPKAGKLGAGGTGRKLRPGIRRWRWGWR